MQVVSEATKKNGKDLYAQQFEFRYCTGSIEIDEEDGLPPVKADLTSEE